jgi:hypothetical protein
MKAFQQIGAILVIGLFFIKSMVAPILFLDYEIRKDFIIQNYCVNKDRPELHCDGKCYLAKRIEATQREDEKQANDQFLSKIFTVETHFVKEVIISRDSRIDELSNVANFAYFERPFVEIHPVVFHPPTLI